MYRYRPMYVVENVVVRRWQRSLVNEARELQIDFKDGISCVNHTFVNNSNKTSSADVFNYLRIIDIGTCHRRRTAQQLVTISTIAKYPWMTKRRKRNMNSSRANSHHTFKRCDIKVPSATQRYIPYATSLERNRRLYIKQNAQT
jgi:hypothetical protein